MLKKENRRQNNVHLPQIHTVMCSLLGFALLGCGPSLKLDDPLGGSWRFKDSTGIQYNAESDINRASYRILATTGLVDGKSIVAGCRCEADKEHCGCEP